MSQFIKVELMCGDRALGSYIDRPKNVNIMDLFDGMRPGEDSYRISVVEMTEEELAALPEFDGF